MNIFDFSIRSTSFCNNWKISTYPSCYLFQEILISPQRPNKLLISNNQAFVIPDSEVQNQHPFADNEPRNP